MGCRCDGVGVEFSSEAPPQGTLTPLSGRLGAAARGAQAPRPAPREQRGRRADGCAGGQVRLASLRRQGGVLNRNPGPPLRPDSPNLPSQQIGNHTTNGYCLKGGGKKWGRAYCRFRNLGQKSDPPKWPPNRQFSKVCQKLCDDQSHKKCEKFECWVMWGKKSRQFHY